jgi:hypothetical protein
MLGLLAFLFTLIFSVSLSAQTDSTQDTLTSIVQSKVDSAMAADSIAASTQTAPETALTGSQAEAERVKSSWFDTKRLNVFIWIVLLSGVIIFYINHAKSGKPIYIRKMAGLEAVDEAVGRATEMGKKIFFVPGIQDMNDVQTIAAIAILGRVATLAAECETWLEVPNSKSLVMVTATETMKESYSRAGRPDSFQESQVYFITDEQFAYAAALDGMIVRERPATILYMGAFYAESLILSEVGNSTGAIQIAGTAEATQLPFFVAACDYVLLGEELFAASAYLSKEPRQLGSLKGQDMGKAFFIIAMVIGIIGVTFGLFDISGLFRAN